MLTINTNLSSLIVQSNLKTSTNGLNNAIERMTTGFKLNHAKDNAANYSISTSLATKLGAYTIAEENAMMGLDMVKTASDKLSLISNNLSRLRSLAMQISNGTYGQQSVDRINTEAKSLLSDTNRVFNTTIYNNQKLFGHTGQFMIDVQTRDTSVMTKLKDIDSNATVTSGTFSISTAEELAKLAQMANDAKIQGGEYVLSNDIDLSAYSTGEGWTPIGLNNWSANHFKGDFDGNGYVVKNLYINRPNGYAQGLFGCIEGSVKNLGVENVNITARDVGSAIVAITMTNVDGNTTYASIENCYSKNGKINLKQSAVGGILGYGHSDIVSLKSCFSDIDVFVSTNNVGGLAGCFDNKCKKVSISDCYATGSVNAGGNAAGGLIGSSFLTENSILNIENCYSSGNVTAKNSAAGGLIAQLWGANQASISNCYATGDVAANSYVGGFVGYTNKIVLSDKAQISNCYSTGNAQGNSGVGGFAGTLSCETKISNCYSTGNVQGNSGVGGFVGVKNSGITLNIQDSYILNKSSSVNAVILGNSVSAQNELIIENVKYSSFYDDIGKKAVLGSVNSDIKNNLTTYDGEVPYLLSDGYFKLQVGINGDNNSQIAINTGFSLDGLNDLYDLSSKDCLVKINELISRVSYKAVELGSAQNKLESALSAISSSYENIVATRSTIKDADVAELSSEYIRNQILQQASATLLATANQNPSIALQLI